VGKNIFPLGLDFRLVEVEWNWNTFYGLYSLPCFTSSFSTVTLRGFWSFSVILVFKFCSRKQRIPFGIGYIMDPQDIIDVCKVLRRHEESLANNEISLRSLFAIMHNMERKTTRAL
jgi:hypothetical protein